MFGEWLKMVEHAAVQHSYLVKCLRCREEFPRLRQAYQHLRGFHEIPDRMLSGHLQLESAEDFQRPVDEENQQFGLKDGGDEADTSDDEDDVDKEVLDVDITFSQASSATPFRASSRQAAQQYLCTTRLRYVMPVRGEQADSPPPRHPSRSMQLEIHDGRYLLRCTICSLLHRTPTEFQQHQCHRRLGIS